MKISIHQSHFFPWLGYFHKILKSDKFVYLDNVQFRKNYFQNRTQVMGSNGRPLWLTIPIKSAPLATPINLIEISPSFQPKKLINTLQNNYSKASFFKELSPMVFKVINYSHITLNEKNLAGIKLILKLLEFDATFIIASELKLNYLDPNRRIIEICKELGATDYLAGKGGKNYMDLDLFKENGINVIWQQFNPGDFKYNQVNGEFVMGLSILDVLFNIGTEGTKKLLKDGYM